MPQHFLDLDQRHILAGQDRREQVADSVEPERLHAGPLAQIFQPVLPVLVGQPLTVMRLPHEYVSEQSGDLALSSKSFDKVVR